MSGHEVTLFLQQNNFLMYKFLMNFGNIDNFGLRLKVQFFQ